jgi:putative DNA primase/helicase
VGKQIYNECAELEDAQARMKMAQWAERSLYREHINAMRELARSDSRIRIENFAEVFDTHPWLINFENGTFDVQEGRLREHHKEDFLTKIIHRSYRPEAECPLWMSFLKNTFGDDLVPFIQKAVGYSITGQTKEKSVFLLIGPTNSGKTTFLTTLREIFSPYSAQLQIDTLMHARQEDNNTRADLADLCGSRFVVTSETEEGHRLREAKLKRITQGMGTIKAVRKYEHPFEFPETHKLWVDCNHRPVVSGSDDAIWIRLVPIPCTHRVPTEQINPDLTARLLVEAEGIIGWAIRGALLWKTEGLGQHEAVTRTREEWRANMDRVGEWLNECCVNDPSAWTSSENLYNDYKSWAERHGQAPMADTSFATRLIDRGFNQKRQRDAGSPKRGFLGLRLRALGEA